MNNCIHSSSACALRLVWLEGGDSLKLMFSSCCSPISMTQNKSIFWSIIKSYTNRDLEGSDLESLSCLPKIQLQWHKNQCAPQKLQKLSHLMFYQHIVVLFHWALLFFIYKYKVTQHILLPQKCCRIFLMKLNVYILGSFLAP